VVDRKHAARPGHCLDLASVFWQEWLSNRKDIQPAKNCATYLQRLSPGTSYKWRKKRGKLANPGSHGKTCTEIDASR